jgi:hypothetical protein
MPTPIAGIPATRGITPPPINNKIIVASPKISEIVPNTRDRIFLPVI